MSSIYLGDHIAGNHIHTEILTGNIEEPHQKYRFEKFSYTLLGAGGGGGLKLVLLAPDLDHEDQTINFILQITVEAEGESLDLVKLV